MSEGFEIEFFEIFLQLRAILGFYWMPYFDIKKRQSIHLLNDSEDFDKIGSKLNSFIPKDIFNFRRCNDSFDFFVKNFLQTRIGESKEFEFAGKHLLKYNN